MTNQEIIAAQLRSFREREARLKTIGAELRKEATTLSEEAANIIDWLVERIAALRRNLNEERRESNRSAQDAYAQGQQDENDRNNRDR